MIKFIEEDFYTALLTPT